MTYLVIYADQNGFLIKKVFDHFRTANAFQDSLLSPSYLISCLNGTQIDYCDSQLARMRSEKS